MPAINRPCCSTTSAASVVPSNTRHKAHNCSPDHSEPATLPSPPAPVGFCGLPSAVRTPAALRAFWYRVTKPRVEALYRACASCGPEEQLLALLDELVRELKNAQAKGRHCAARHEDRWGWAMGGTTGQGQALCGPA